MAGNLVASLHLSEALQQQTATADVLKVVSRSTFELETGYGKQLATRACVVRRRRSGDVLHGAAGGAAAYRRQLES